MPALDERTGVIILGVGLFVAAVGLIWLVIRLLPVIRDLFARGFKPFLVVLLGTAIAASPIVLNKLAGDKVNDKAVQTTTAGGADEVLRLTGAARDQYEVLKSKKSFAVVKWANKDVTDDDLDALRGMDNLRDLDLNSSQITDRSLPLLASLPKLESLRLLGTKITDAGFRTHLLPLVGLKRLDLTNTAVTGPTAREWKAAAAGRELVR